MTIEYFFRQLKVSGFECIVDNSSRSQRLPLTGWRYRQEDICLCGGMVPCLSSSDAHVDFKMIDGTLNNRSYFISAVPFIGIMLDTGEYT